MISVNSNAPGAKALAELALTTAQSQIGQSEKPIGSNSGPMVNEYLAAAGLKPGYPWCQAFVYWCYDVAAKKCNELNPLVKTASVHECWEQTTAKSGVTKITTADALKQPELIKPGDQFVLYFPGNTGHTGIVEKVEGPAAGEPGKWIIHTIEGNSNTNGSREGYEVVRHKRNISDPALQGFIQYA